MSPSVSSDPIHQWVPLQLEGKPSCTTFARPIVQSPNDDRAYRIIKLQNNLQALLISDPKTDKAAASLSVGVGHLSDPDDRPGLAHFCEHLLFMGTRQFPKENEYGEYVEQNGGRANAYTATNNTNYYFSVSSHALRGALERFSAFFHSPLFSPSCTTREILAVDSENKKNKQSDVWRLFQLDKGLSKDGARWTKFGSGNWESLMRRERSAAPDNTPAKAADGHANGHELANGTGAHENGVSEAGREVRSILLDWYARHYSANIMTLAVYGKETLDELASTAVELFSPVSDRKLPPLYTESSPVPPLNSPWGAAEEGSTLYVKSVMDFRAVEVRWVVPCQTFRYKQKSLRLLSHLLGHEGPGSIFAVLKKKGWVTRLSAARSSGDVDNGFDFVRVQIVLTPEGLDNYASVVRTVYAYVSLIDGNLPSYHHDEMKTIASTAFRFAGKTTPEDYVTSLSETLGKPYAREHVLSASSLVHGDWDNDAQRNLGEIVGKHVLPEKARVTVMLRNEWDRVRIDGKPLWEHGAEKAEWEKEKWYGTEYVVCRTDFSDGQAAEGLHLPEPNAFIAEQFGVEKQEVLEPTKRPLKIRETSLSTLWYKKDDQFWVPKASYTLLIRSPLTSITPRNSAMTRLFVELVNDALDERTYDAELAGMRYHFGAKAHGLAISVAGYSAKIDVLLDTVLKEMKSFVVDSARFAVQKEELRQEWENALLEQPNYLAEFKAAQVVRDRSWGEQEKLNELRSINVEDLQAHIATLLSRTHIEALIHGNVTKSDAIGVIKRSEETLNSKSLTSAERISLRCYILPPGANLVYDAPVPNKDDVNSALTYYCQVGDPTDRRLRTTLHLLAQIAKEPAFNQLRTKEQLGYIVFSGYWTFTGTMGFKITVQSERRPVYLESRVDAFLEQLRATIETMSAEDFDKQRQSLIDKKLTKIKNLPEEAQRFVEHIEDGYCDFLSREFEAEILKTLSKDDVLALLMAYIHPNSPTRSKLSVHLCSQKSRSPRVSAKAANVLLEHFKAAGIPVKEAEFNAAAKLQLSTDVHQSAWRNYFEKEDPTFDKKIAAELVDLIVKVAKQHPLEDDHADGKLKEGAVYIDNLAALKSRLMLGPAATPVEAYPNLSGSKL